MRSRVDLSKPLEVLPGTYEILREHGSLPVVQSTNTYKVLCLIHDRHGPECIPTDNTEYPVPKVGDGEYIRRSSFMQPFLLIQGHILESLSHCTQC